MRPTLTAIILGFLFASVWSPLAMHQSNGFSLAMAFGVACFWVGWEVGQRRNSALSH